MEVNKATIQRSDDQTSLILNLDVKELNIILTDDNPNNIKGVFNELLKELKKGSLSFELDDDKEDLYNSISKEYLLQLNSELETIYNELEEYDLTEE